MKLIPLFLIATALFAQAATRNVTVTWVASTTTQVTGYTVSTGTSATGPFTQIACTGTVPGSTCVTGSTASTVIYQDTETVGSTIYYALVAVAPVCTPTTPLTTPCGNSKQTISAAIPIPAITAAPGTITIVIN